MSQESDAVPFEWTPCDIVGELQGRNIYDVTDHILYCLDWASLKNVGLVSKSWRVAMLVTLGRIVQKGNPNWSAEQLTSWIRFKSHIKNGFKIPLQDPRYSLCLPNSIRLIIDHLWDGCCPDLVSRRPEPEMTLDYLPYQRNFTEDPLVYHLCRMEMSDNFIVAWESSTRLFKCWTRRTLSPISMDQEFQMRRFPSISLDEVNKQFRLLGNDLFYAESSTSDPRGNFAKVNLTKVDLDARRRGVDEGEEFKADIYVEPPRDKADMSICYLNVVEDMISLGFAVSVDGKWVEDSFTVQRKLERGETRTVLKCDTLQTLPQGRIYLDKDYLVIQWLRDPDEYELYNFRTYSVRPPKEGSSAMELHWIASFELWTPVSVDYKNGLFAYATMFGHIALIDVSNGNLLKTFPTQMNCFAIGRTMRLTRDFVICRVVHDKKSVDNKIGTTFHVWNLRSIMQRPNVKLLKADSTPTSHFRTFTNKRDMARFKVDDLGIVAIVDDDSAMGIQVLSPLPACSHCKRLTKPALLKKCTRCSSAAYCSKECETADWNPHHEAICGKVVPLSFA